MDDDTDSWDETERAEENAELEDEQNLIQEERNRILEERREKVVLLEQVLDDLDRAIEKLLDFAADSEDENLYFEKRLKSIETERDYIEI